MSQMKQVIVLRKDLNMRKGKMVAQGAHASMKAILDLGKVERSYSDIDGQLEEVQYSIPLFKIQKPFTGQENINLLEVVQWLEDKFTKVCVGVGGEDELLQVYTRARDAGLVCSLIQDAGLTEFGGVPTYTAVAVGPGRPEDIDKITGELKLL